MWEAIAGLAAATVAVLGLVTYVVKRQDSPRSLYKEAIADYEQAVKDEEAILARLRAELDKGVPDRKVFEELSRRSHTATRRVRECREERDRLRASDG